MFHALHYRAIYQFFVRLDTLKEVNLLFEYPAKNFEEKIICKIQNIANSGSPNSLLVSIICCFL